MEIPPYPEMRPIGLDDKPLLDPIFFLLQPRVSELTFANLFLFRGAHDYRLTFLGDSIIVVGRGYDGEDYVLPPLNGDVAGALVQLFAHGLMLYGADDEFLAKHLATPNLRSNEDRDNFDYLYHRRELADLPGNRYHNKRNRISYFATRHAYEVLPYTVTLREGCSHLLDRWLRVRGEHAHGSLLAEAEATRQALHLWDVLGLQGLVIVVEGEVKAFVFGERLNRETSVCHFEKADPFLEGLSQLADREFNRLLFTDCVLVNREQDLGEQGLRDAKLSYHPVALVKKFRVRGR